MAKGDEARRRGDWAAAAAAYRRALRYEPGHAAIWVQYGHALKEQSRLAEAETAYRQAIALADQVADSFLQLGHALKLQCRLDAAAEAYLAALSRDPRLLDAKAELVGLGWSTRRIAQQLTPETTPAATAGVVVEASDLFHHFLQHGRIATGIQRVQLNLLAGLLALQDAAAGMAIVSYVVDRGHWVEIPRRLYRDLTGSGGGDQWADAQRELRLELEAGDPYRFAPGAALINLGTSWWLPEYFLAWRNVQEAASVRLYHFVHDLIPVFRPELCVTNLVRDFLPWIVNLPTHAEGLLTNSAATADDLDRLWRSLGIQSPPRRVIRLDGQLPGDGAAAAAGRGLPQFGIAGPFVLFVATLEARKNHAFAFAAWQRRIERCGAAQTPLLVCVGRRGWLFDAADQLLRSEPRLAERLRVLSDVSDGELAGLYRAARFVILPSLCEGWGLPISEALGHGRVPLAADIPALREAGSRFAEYFTDAADFDRRLDRLIDDDAYRAKREAAIAGDYRPQSWQEIAAGALAAVLDWQQAAAAAISAPIVPPDVYLPLYYSRETDLCGVVRSGTIYRIGEGWAAPDEFGSALLSPRSELRLRLGERGDGAHLLFLHLQNPAGEDVRLQIETATAGQWRGKLMPHSSRCVPLRLAPAPGEEHRIAIGNIDADPPAASVRLLGLYLCREGDQASRHRFLAAVALGELTNLTCPVTAGCDQPTHSTGNSPLGIAAISSRRE